MNSIIMFLVVTITVLVYYLWTNFNSFSELKIYFTTDLGKGIAKGIIMVVLVVLIIVGFSYKANAEEYKATWFNYTEVFVGLDTTKNISPQCHSGGKNDKLTSNVGFRQNIFKSGDDKFNLNAKYTHHSCALNQDRNSYDGFGLEMTYRFIGQ